jgi:excisionase family DNA binding protein
METEVQLLRAWEVAPMLGVTTRRVYQIIRAGRLPALHEGRSVVVPRLALEEWLRRRANEALAGMAQPTREPESAERQQ